MSYYDNVKDNVKDKKSGASNKPSFDTLKEAAEETSVEDEEENANDDTPIEVLEEGGLRKETSSQQQSQSKTSNQTRSQASSGGSTNVSQENRNVDMSSVEQKLDKLIEQNQKIIEVLESFGQ